MMSFVVSEMTKINMSSQIVCPMSKGMGANIKIQLSQYALGCEYLLGCEYIGRAICNKE